MKAVKYTIVCFCLLFCFQSCKKDSQHKVYHGYEYFPTDTGKYVIYKVDSTIWDEFAGTLDTSVCYIKEIIQSKFIDNSNHTAQRIERYIRFSDTSVWVLRDVWVSNINEMQAERVEENIRYIKMVFPVAQGSEWNGNALNANGFQVYEYKDAFTTTLAGGMSLDSAVTVIQQDNFIPLYSKDFEEEIYIKNAGMAYKRSYHVRFRTNGTIKSGTDVQYILQSHN